MIFDLPADVPPAISPDFLRLPGVQAYLATLANEAPGLDLTWDRAIVAGLLVIRDADLDALDEHRALLRETFDEDEADVLVAAALAFLDARERSCRVVHAGQPGMSEQLLDPCS